MFYTTNTTRQTILNMSKKFAFIVALFLTVGVGSSFAATNEDMSNMVRASFQRDFQKTELINSEVSKEFTKLTFKMNDMVLFAFYSENGELLAVTRNIRTSQLPIQLMLQLKKDYNDFWVTDLFELTGQEMNNYYITVEDADKKVTLRSSDNHHWEVYEKVSKK